VRDRAKVAVDYKWKIAYASSKEMKYKLSTLDDLEGQY